MHEIREAREEALHAILEMGKALRTYADTAESKYLDRLLSDRDELLARAHFMLDIPVLELASKTGITWMDVYALIDAVKARQRQRSPFSGMFDTSASTAGLDIPDSPPTPDEGQS